MIAFEQKSRKCDLPDIESILQTAAMITRGFAYVDNPDKPTKHKLERKSCSSMRKYRMNLEVDKPTGRRELNSVAAWAHR